MNHHILVADGSLDPLTPLGLTVIHSLWIGALFAAALAIALRTVLRNAGPSPRYRAACLTLLGLTLTMTGVHAHLAKDPSTSFTVSHGEHGTAWAAALTSANPETPAPPRSLSTRPSPWPALIGLCWSVGALISLSRTAAGWCRLGILCHRAENVTDPAMVRAFEQTRARLGIAERVRLASSGQITVPLMTGFLWPTVLIPVGLLHGAPLGYLQSIFAHELAHHRRWDYLTHLGIRCLLGLFFYHPAVAWIAAQIEEERERACDDLAVYKAANRAEYVRALAWLECRRSGLPSPAMTGVSGGTLARLRRLTRSNMTPAPVSAPAFVPTSLSFATGSILLALLLVNAPLPLGAVPRDESVENTDATAPWIREIQGKVTEVRKIRRELQDSPRQWREPGKEHLFVSPVVIERNGAVYRLDEETPQLFPEFPNRYLIENRLDYLDADLPLKDPDGDGFTVLEEYAADSDPKSSESHPPLTDRLRFISRKVKLYRVSFDALPDGRQAQLTRHASVGRTRTVYHVSSGDTTPDGDLRVDAITATELAVEHLATGTRHRLPKGEIVEIPTWYAEFHFELGSESRRFFVQQGDTFTLGSEAERPYRVLSITTEEAIVRETTDSAASLSLPALPAP